MDWLKGSSLILYSFILYNISYRKIVAGVANFAVVSAMVVPAAFAAEATASGAPTPAPAKNAIADAKAELQKVIDEADKAVKELKGNNVLTLAVEKAKGVLATADEKGLGAAELNTYEVEKQVELLKKAVAELERFLLKTDPSTLTPKGLKARQDAEKKGKKLPKTAGQTLVAPFAAAAAATLIVAGLVASHKVNA